MLNCTVGGQQGVDRRHQLRKKFTIIEQKKSFAEKEGKGLKKGGKKEKRKKKERKEKDGINWIIKRCKKGPKMKAGQL